MTPKKSRLSPGVWTVLCLLLALCLWEWAAAAGHVNDYFFSRPSALWAEFLELVSSGLLAKHLSVTLGPVFIIWFGLGLRSKVIMSALMVFFIFVFNLYTGVRGVDPALLSGVRLLGASQGQLLTKVIWPACLPWLLTSLRTGLGLSLSGAIVGEYLGSTKGMGWLLSAAGDVFNSTRVLCCVLVLVVLIIALDAVVHLLEWRLLRWRG